MASRCDSVRKPVTVLVRLKPRFAFEGDVLLPPAEGDGGAAADEPWGERGDFDALTGVADVRELLALFCSGSFFCRLALPGVVAGLPAGERALGEREDCTR